MFRFICFTPLDLFCVFFFCHLALWHSRHASLVASLASMNSEMLDEFYFTKRGRHNRLYLKSCVQIYREGEIKPTLGSIMTTILTPISGGRTMYK